VQLKRERRNRPWTVEERKDFRPPSKIRLKPKWTKESIITLEIDKDKNKDYMNVLYDAELKEESGGEERCIIQSSWIYSFDQYLILEKRVNILGPLHRHVNTST
jgi:hypothetical protein